MVESSLRNVYGNPDKVTPELVDRYFELTIRQGNRAALVQRFAQVPHGPGAERIPGLRIPTLILWGARDRLIPPDHAERFHRDIAGSRVVVFPGLGHTPHEEDPATTVKVVQDFLAGP
jgi:pimeloyl-ACP methyl ester carboxylesterase